MTSKISKSVAGLAGTAVLVLAIGLVGHGTADASPRGNPTPTPTPTSTPTTPATSTAPPVILKQGQTAPRVRYIEARLRQLGWLTGKVDDFYGPRTTTAMRAFQTKHNLKVVGYLTPGALQRLKAITKLPTKGELANRYTDGTWTGAALDKRCKTGRALCVDKRSRTLRWVVDGEVRTTFAVRFGASYTPTREGLFHVYTKSRDHVSSLYGSSMPFAMFFSGGQAVHYSSDFAAKGYSGASHGCVNVRDYNGLKKLFDKVKVGDKVVVYWS